MLSRRVDYLVQRNRFSLLLAFLRDSLSPSHFRGLLRAQLLADCRAVRGKRSIECEKMWLNELKNQLDACFSSLSEGRVSKQQLTRIVHIYQHLLL
jgi:hypothetical protein